MSVVKVHIHTYDEEDIDIRWEIYISGKVNR